jgi:hypothetical protein
LVFGIYCCNNPCKICDEITHMKEPEYTEGPEAMENFEKMATAIFQRPKLREGKRGRSLTKRLANASLNLPKRIRTIPPSSASLSFGDVANHSCP